MNRKIKIFIIILITLFLILFATETFAIDSMIQNIDKVGNGSLMYMPDTNKNIANVIGIGGKILGYTRNIAVVVGVISLTIIGIKYMLGSVEEKAEYKKTLIPFAVGIFIVASATTLLSILFGIKF